MSSRSGSTEEEVKPKYVGPFKVLGKCYADEPLDVPLDGLHFDDKLQFAEEPVKIMELQERSKRGPKFTWERKDQFKKKCPHLFTKTTPSLSVAS
ncbi:hypothetical protein Tco_0977021 [Tanacetum coccineum]|uniref:Reverse transcriptase domain-containing protein n=1 Tax=Tanacetum coccineum TaxID=301880 RepID=A0ABQ5EIZ6_9ASTR